MSGAVDKDVVSEFECPICNEYMQPPIRQCATGHSFCDGCFSRITTCSICTLGKSTVRNFTLEKLYEKLRFPCKYAANGCSFILKGSEMADHVIKCDNRIFNCPISMNCKWMSKLATLEDHVKEEHENFLHYHTKTYFPLATDMKCKQISIEKVHNELFLLELQPKDNTMIWGVYHLGSNEKTEKFSYKINISNKIVMRYPCLHSYRYGYDNTDKSVMVSIKGLDDYLGKDNKIQFNLAITEAP